VRILLLTPYTGWNQGDGAIQDAAIHHLRKRFPEPQIQLVTLCPRLTSKLHGLPSFPIASVESDNHLAFEEPRSSTQDFPKAGVNRGELVKRGLQSAPWIYRGMKVAWRPVRRITSFLRLVLREIHHLFRVHRLLDKTDLLIMSGGGQIDDYWGGPFGQPYALFKWASLAKFTHTPVVFLSVGVCSLRARLSRHLAFRALRLAAYRSYRDQGSKSLLHEASFTRSDPECPDLAFSHPQGGQPATTPTIPTPRCLVVGISPITYLSPHGWPEHNPDIYGRYLQTLSEFAEEVLGAGHSVVLFTSAWQDRFGVNDLQKKLDSSPRRDSWGDRLRQAIPPCADDLLTEIGRIDLVVASRLHGIILSHLLSKPVLALSYDRKVGAHMEAMGQKRFCLDLHDFKLPELRDAFGVLELESPAISASVRSKVKEYRQKLDRQYDLLIRLMGASVGKVS
jgi:polysaccharide pyruvyl transferase WcaK-like protein